LRGLRMTCRSALPVVPGILIPARDVLDRPAPTEFRRNGVRIDRSRLIMRKPRRVVRPGMERLDDRCPLSGYDVAQLRHAYGLDAITFTSASGQPVVGGGSGGAIAPIEGYADPHLAS